MDWKKKFSDEIQMAAEARQHGNEGKARVCARRAAGEVVREYFNRRGISVRTSSVYDLLKTLLENPDLPPAPRREAEYLTLRMTEDFNLPVEVDLIQSAVLLAQSLLPDAD